VQSDKVPTPVSVRYGFKDWAPGNLYSTEGLPVAPFRTDDW
jgi:sialate O-acetylesterase